jgi:hypothetical protein
MLHNCTKYFETFYGSIFCEFLHRVSINEKRERERERDAEKQILLYK